MFIITYLSTTSTTVVTLKTLEGYVSADSITAIGTVEITPKMTSVYPSIGSTMGTTVLVTAPGIGINTENVMLNASISGVSTDLCASVTVFEYGRFYCVTNAMTIPDGTTI